MDRPSVTNSQALGRPSTHGSQQQTAWIGTSGWQYRDWRGRFYPEDAPARSWLECYAKTFCTTEVNNTFYRLPARSTFERWDQATPLDFVMAVKASRFLTHIKRLQDPLEPVERLLSATEGLGQSLGPVLFQLPPTLPLDVELLAGLLDAIGGRVKAALEFRHPSWTDRRVRELLEKHQAAWVCAHTPGASATLFATADWTYLRFHRGGRSRAGYRFETLRRWADALAGLPIRESFIYFNNDPGAAAPRDAARFRRLLIERGIDVPTP